MLYPRHDFPFGHLGNPQAVAYVLRDREVGKKCVVLKHRVDAAAIGREMIEAFSSHQYLAGSDGFKAGDDAQQSGLAGAALAEDGEELALGDIERNAAKHRGFSERLGEVADGEQDAGRSGISSRTRLGIRQT